MQRKTSLMRRAILSLSMVVMLSSSVRASEFPIGGDAWRAIMTQGQNGMWYLILSQGGEIVGDRILPMIKHVIPLGPGAAPAAGATTTGGAGAAGGSTLTTVAVAAGEVIVIVGTAVVATILIDRGINGNWFWEAPGMDLLVSGGVNTGPRSGYITVGCQPDIPGRCAVAAGSIILEQGYLWNTYCSDRPSNPQCVAAVNQCITDTQNVCNAPVAAVDPNVAAQQQLAHADAVAQAIADVEVATSTDIGEGDGPTGGGEITGPTVGAP
jgi:hypothetical protein